MLKAFIVEDEPLARDELTYLLRRTGEAEVIGEADGIELALDEISRLEPDIVFLDMELSQGSGLELAKKFQQMAHAPAVVFATAYDEYALQAFELDAADYILKPFDEERIRHTLEKLRKRLEPGGDDRQGSNFTARASAQSDRIEKLAVPHEGRILILDTASIVYVSAQEGKTVLKTANNHYVLDGTLAETERKLGAVPFLRVHRSYIVNLNEIAEIDPWFNGTYNLAMRDGSKIPVSRTYVKQLRHLLGF